jgi:hypothetical protein
MVQVNAADCRRESRGKRRAIEIGPAASRVGGIASRPACATIHRDEVGTWEDEGGTVLEKHQTAVEGAERPQRVATSGSGTPPTHARVDNVPVSSDSRLAAAHDAGPARTRFIARTRVTTPARARPDTRK